MRVALESENGTSPRGWGEGHDDAPEIAAERNIPTRVGRRSGRSPSRSDRSEHPHAGGEKATTTTATTGMIGTSPRGWGEVTEDERLDKEVRNIPTRVGRSDRQEYEERTNPEHPHAGGEKAEVSCATRVSNGTSPRGWGEASRPGRSGRCPRNIPTRVGRSGGGTAPTAATTEHPHAGGEKMILSIVPVIPVGTSPRGWGEGVVRVRWHPRARNIPTRVGRRLTLSFPLNE